MLGPRAGTTLVGLLTVAPEVFDEVAEVRIPPEVHERLVAWRARFGLAIDNALNFLNNPDGIQGHNFATQIAHVEERRVLQGRLTLVRYNNEPQFFVADASVFLGLVADVMERLAPYLEPDGVDAETVVAAQGRRPAHRAEDHRPDVASGQRRRGQPADVARPMRQVYLAATGMNRGKTTVCLGFLDGCLSRGLATGFLKPVGQRTVIEDGVPADEDAVLMRDVFGLAEPMTVMSPVHIPRGFTKAYISGGVVEDLGAAIRAAHADLLPRPRRAPDRGHRARRRRRRRGALERRPSRRCSARRRSSSARAAWAGRSTRSSSMPRSSSRTACRVAGAIVNKVRRRRAARHPRDPGARPRPVRHPAARRAARTGASSRTRPSA